MEDSAARSSIFYLLSSCSSQIRENSAGRIQAQKRCERYAPTACDRMLGLFSRAGCAEANGRMAVIVAPRGGRLDVVAQHHHRRSILRYLYGTPAGYHGTSRASSGEGCSAA